MNIYASTRVMPYVYLATNYITKEFYYGVRWANKVPSTQDIGTVYKTSSKRVKPIADQFNFQVLAEFFSVDDAFIFEQSLIQETCRDELSLNAGAKQHPNFTPNHKKYSQLGNKAMWDKYNTDESFRVRIKMLRQKQSADGKNPMQGKHQSRVSCIHCKKEFPVNLFNRKFHKCQHT